MLRLGRNVRGDVHRAQIIDEGCHVVAFVSKTRLRRNVGAERDAAHRARVVRIEHVDGGASLGCAVVMRQMCGDRKAVAVLHQRVAKLASLGYAVTVALLGPTPQAS